MAPGGPRRGERRAGPGEGGGAVAPPPGKDLDDAEGEQKPRRGRAGSPARRAPPASAERR